MLHDGITAQNNKCTLETPREERQVLPTLSVSYHHTVQLAPKHYNFRGLVQFKTLQFSSVVPLLITSTNKYRVRDEG